MTKQRGDDVDDDDDEEEEEDWQYVHDVHQVTRGKTMNDGLVVFAVQGDHDDHDMYRSRLRPLVSLYWMSYQICVGFNLIELID